MRKLVGLDVDERPRKLTTGVSFSGTPCKRFTVPKGIPVLDDSTCMRGESKLHQDRRAPANLPRLEGRLQSVPNILSENQQDSIVLPRKGDCCVINLDFVWICAFPWI